MIKFYNFRVTKYNPQNRDENGFYQKDEWTSVSDIGNKYDGVEFTFDEYLAYENAYIDAVLRIMRENGLGSLKVDSLEKHYYKNYADFTEIGFKKCYRSLKNNMLISIKDIAQIVRFALREIIWCKLVSDKMFVHFGYDYYMYIGSEKPLEEEITSIEKNGLFVETVLSPYL